MSDIGPGDWVVRVRADSDFGLVAGALYQIAEVVRPDGIRCDVCGQDAGGLMVKGKVEAFLVVDLKAREASLFQLCPCGFRKWPPPADEELRSEGVDADEEQPSKHIAKAPA